jgi:hypothetical protein
MAKLWFIATSSFRGYAPGAEHYYVKVMTTDRLIEPALVMTAEYAAELTAKDDTYGWEAGDVTNRFKTEAEAKAAAAAVARHVMQPGDAVVFGSALYIEPHEPVEGAPEFMEAARHLWGLMAALEAEVGDDIFTRAPDRADALANAWQELVKPFEERDYSQGLREQEEVYVRADGDDWIVYDRVPR